MKESTFSSIWNKWAVDWLENGIIEINGNCVPVRSFCKLKENYNTVIRKRYLKIKEIIKDSYFREEGKLVSRYKRAAIIAYAINGASPLDYEGSLQRIDIERLFLKQRLAFHVALGSIIQDYSKDEVAWITGQRNLFDFKELGIVDIANGEDDFLTSVYKDLFFAEVYENYNVLTMANVFGLLTERASALGSLTPIVAAEE